MKIAGSVVVVTGANRGIGTALVQQLLKAGAGKVYAGARDISKLDALKREGAGKVVPLKIDLNDSASIAAAAKAAPDATLLINNAGALEYGSQLEASESSIRSIFDTNYFGTIQVSRAFAPAIVSKKGAIANVLSVVSFVSMPGIGGYSASKAAAHSFTLALRGELAKKGTQVFGIYPGPVDTDMAKDITLPKTSPTDVALDIIRGINADEFYIFPDPMAKQVAEGFKSDHRALETQFGSM